MTIAKASGDYKALRALYQEDEYAKVMLDDFANRTNNQRVTEVEQLRRRLRSAELPKSAVVQLFRSLEGLNYGRFVVGRRGAESRFIWSASLVDVGKAAQGQELSIATIPEPDTPETEMVSHRFNLRPGMPVNIELPADFTEKEAERFSHFLRAAVR